MPNFARRLKREAKWQLIARSLGALVVGFLCWSGLLILLDLYDAFSPIQETEISNWILGALICSSLFFLILLIYAWIKRPNPKDLARTVESANPELGDLLNTAIEIEGRKEEPKFMERRVLAQLDKRSPSMDWGKGLRPTQRFWNFLLFGFLGGVLLSFWNYERSPMSKVRAVVGGEPGLEVWTGLSGVLEEQRNSPEAEYRRGADVLVNAHVIRGHRGVKEAWIEWADRNRTSRSSMLPSGSPDKLEFVLPSLTENLRYRVVTPSLQSGWYVLRPYDPPELEFARWEITPPAYLKMDSLIHEGFGYIEAPENSSIRLDVRVKEFPPEVSARLLSNDLNFSMEKVGRVTFSWSGKMEKEWSGRLGLSDPGEPTRPEVLHDGVTFSPIPDEPPIVEISEPAKDLELPFDAEPLLIEVFAADDHGVSELSLHVSHDGVKKDQDLFIDPIEKEKAVTGILDLSEYPLAVGDVITYMAFAADNREPEKQIARSEIYFIEILPPEGNSTDSDSQAGGDMGGDTKEIPVRQFINRTKQIIRDTYDALMEEGVRREELSLNLCTEALSLKNEMTQTYDEFEGMFPIVDGLDLGELLNEATYHIEQTEIYTGEQELEQSIESSEQTLRKLVQLYALMQQMEKQKAQGQGEGKPSESAGKEGEQKEEMEAEEGDDPEKQLENLAKELEQLKDLEERQDSVNEEIGKAAGRGQSGQSNQDLASEQEGIRRDLDALRKQRYDRTGKLGDVANLDRAGREMKEGAADLRRDEPRQAQPHGDLAAEALGNAISQVEREMSQLAADMIDQLTNQAEQLGEGQGQLSGKTENAKGGHGEKLREEQESLNEGIEDLLEKIDRTGRSLGKFEERAMDDLLNLSRDARAGDIEKSGRRASNSLLYDAFPQAQKEQDKLENELNGLQSGLQQLEDKLRYGESSALGELAEQLQRISQEGQGMGEQQFRQANEEAAQAVGSLPDADSDERLLNLTRMFEESAIAEDIRNGRSMSAGAVEEASRLMEQFLWEKAAEQSLLRNHQSTQAPARYRKQVQEYFRRIAEGK